MMEQSRAFFALPEGKKMEVLADKLNRGYTPWREEVCVCVCVCVYVLVCMYSCVYSCVCVLLCGVVSSSFDYQAAELDR
jgi:hypothetical protein